MFTRTSQRASLASNRLDRHLTRPSDSTREYRASKGSGLSLRRLTRVFAECPFGFSLELPDQDIRNFGNGPPILRIQLHYARALGVLASCDEGRIADAYLAGAFDVQGDILRMFDLRRFLHDSHPLGNAWRFLQVLLLGQIRANAGAIRHHYDLDPDFYLSFLGETRCYTQGIFEAASEELDAAVRRKFDFCLTACQLKQGDHVLEVGPGWGAFSEYAAQRGLNITGVTISEASKRYMDELGRRLVIGWSLHLQDILKYAPGDRYDAIVLMGILEHLPDYRLITERLADLVRPGGFVYIDASAARRKYSLSSFIFRHIYPANHSFLSLDDFLRAVARSPFRLRGVYDDQHNYFLTFQRWALNFEHNRDRVVSKFGERNYRRFRLYLWGSAHSFLTDVLQCYRIVLERPA